MNDYSTIYVKNIEQKARRMRAEYLASFFGRGKR